ncbi:hypothetical protein EVJ58_g10236 [Rhodofomes roseus]|uniref:Uncharacterized protein n=1 Tax=Rhodofomes roseus TaxID=34475 RepID=A0A4Y9XU10_9APHY|nr:hypothetical protein EVJ58_g10236 [Rhodofomes roseus]
MPPSPTSTQVWDFQPKVLSNGTAHWHAGPYLRNIQAPIARVTPSVREGRGYRKLRDHIKRMNDNPEAREAELKEIDAFVNASKVSRVRRPDADRYIATMPAAIITSDSKRIFPAGGPQSGSANEQDGGQMTKKEKLGRNPDSNPVIDKPAIVAIFKSFKALFHLMKDVEERRLKDIQKEIELLKLKSKTCKSKTCSCACHIVETAGPRGSEDLDVMEE